MTCKRCLSILSTVTALVALMTGGCPATPSDSSNGNSQNSNSPGNSGNPAGSVSNEQRSAVFSSINTILADQSPDDLPAAAKAIADALRSASAIESVGVNDDGSVWAIFADGRPLVVAVNRPIDESLLSDDDSNAAPKPRDVQPRSRTVGARDQKRDSRSQADIDFHSLPNSENAYLFNTIGPSLEVDSHLLQLDFWLREGGYNIALPSYRGTVENLRQVHDAAVVYINGHGGHGYLRAASPDQPATRVYALGTVTQRASDGSTDATYQDDLDNGRLGYLIRPTFIVLPQQGVKFGEEAASVYFVTDRFIREYWTFADAGQTYLDVCSGSAEREIGDACFSKNCGVFISWNGVVRLSDTYETSQYYFSRTLGAVEGYVGYVTAEDPPQRPFDTYRITDYMNRIQRRNPHQIPGVQPTMLDESFTLVNLGHNESFTSLLRMRTADNTNSALLRPAISNLTVNDEDGTLTIGGEFGFEWPLALVTVGGATTELIEGGPGYIKCKISDDAAGPVVVTLLNKESNARNLTLWTGTANVESSAPEGTMSIALEIKIRGDLQNYRLFPGEEPSQWAGGFSSSCIPGLSRISGHGVDLTFPCNRQDRSDDRQTVNLSGGYPPYRALDIGGPGFFFGHGAEPPTPDDSGNWTGTFFWSGVIEDGINAAINCVEEPRTQSQRFDSPAGGVIINVSLGNLSINETDSYDIDSFSGPVTITSQLHLTPSFPPTASDAR